MNQVKIRKPSESLIHAYKEKKKRFTLTLKRDVERTVKITTKKVTRTDISSLIEKIKENKERYLRKVRNKIVIDKDLIALDFNLEEVQARRVSKVAHKELEAKAMQN